MMLFKCLVPLLVLLLVDGSSATFGLLKHILNPDHEDCLIHGILHSKQKQHDPTTPPPNSNPTLTIINTGSTTQVGDKNAGTAGTQNTVYSDLRQGPTNGNGNVYSDAPGNAQQPPQYETSDLRNLRGVANMISDRSIFQEGDRNIGSVGIYNEGSSSRVPRANSASKADAYAGSRGLGSFAGIAGNTSDGTASSGSGLGEYSGSNEGSFGVNAKADAVATAGLIHHPRDSLPIPQDIFKEGAELIGSNLNLTPLPVSSSVLSSSASATANFNGTASANAKANSQAFSGSDANANTFATANAQAGAYAKDDYYGPTGQQSIRGGNQILTGPGQSNVNADATANASANAYANANVNANANANGNLQDSGSTPSCGGCSGGNGNAAANAEATATANREANSGYPGRNEAQNPSHVSNPAMYSYDRIAPEQFVPPQGWSLVPVGPWYNANTYSNDNGNVYTHAPGNAKQSPQSQINAQVYSDGKTNVPRPGVIFQRGDRNIGSVVTYNEGFSSPVPGVDSASKTDAYAGSSGVGGFGGIVAITSGGSASSGTEPGGYGGSNEGSFGVNAKADAVATAVAYIGQQPIRGGNQIMAASGQSTATANVRATATANANANANANAYANTNANANANANADANGNLQQSGSTPFCGGCSGGNGNAAANAEATATANRETNSGYPGRNEAQNPSHVFNPAMYSYRRIAPQQFVPPQGWSLVPVGSTTFGASTPSYSNWFPWANSASKAYANAANSVVGGSGGNAGIISGATASATSGASSGSGLRGNGGSTGGSFGVNAKADAVAIADASSFSWTDGSHGSSAYRQGLSGGLSSAISNVHSNAFGASTSSSSKSTANGSGNVMAQSSSSAISTDGGKSSASSYASASADTNV